MLEAADPVSMPYGLDENTQELNSIQFSLDSVHQRISNNSDFSKSELVVPGDLPHPQEKR